MNGPDDFNFVVDRAYAPGRGRKLRFTKEWIAYVDDLTVRSGRVIDGQFYTDSEADQAIRDACSKGSVATPRSAGAALEALGVRQQGATDKRSKHDSAKADTNHPTRVSVSRSRLGLSGFGWVCGVPGRAFCLVAGHGPGGVLVSSVHEQVQWVQQVRSASRGLGNSLCCSPLGKPEPVCEAPSALRLV